MTSASTGWSLVTRTAAATVVIALLASLPIVIRSAIGPDRMTGALIVPVGDGVAISAPLPLSNRLPLTINSGLILRGAGEHGASGVMIDEAVVSLDLSGDRAGAAAPSVFPETRPGTLQQIAGFASDTVRLTRTLVTITGPHGLDIRLDDMTATITATRKGTQKLVATGRIGDQPIAIDAVWSEAVTREGTPQIPVKLALRSPVLELALDGHLKEGEALHFAGQADILLPHVRRFAKWAGLGHGVSHQLHSVSVSGPVEWSTKAMSFAKANVTLNGNHAMGALTIKHGAERLSLDGTLGFQEFDFGRTWSAFASDSKKEQHEPHILTVLDADLRLSASKIYAPAVEMGRGAVSIALNKGHLQADIAELEIEGGIAGGQLALDLTRPAPLATFKAKLRGVDAGRILGASLRRNALLGRSNLAFEGTLAGRSFAEALAAMSGKGTFDLAEPGRIGIDIQSLVHAARNATAVDWAASGKGATLVDTLTARFRVLNGALTVESFQARNSSAMLVGSGRLDVPARLMDVSVATGPPGTAGDTPFAAQDVLEFRGTWDAPAISLLQPPKAKTREATPIRSH